MLVQPEEVAELNRCYRCDCKTRSTRVCTWQGEPCKECFSFVTYQHFLPNPAEPGLYVKVERPLVNRAIPRSLQISEIPTDGNGDCLYDCIARALGTDTEWVPIADLRSFVARKQTTDNFSAYKTLASQSEEYSVLSRVRSLRGFQNVIRRCGSDVGPEECLWGDENVLNIISTAYKVRFAVFDDRGKIIQIIMPEETIGEPHTILIRLSRRVKQSEHYTLLSLNGQTLLQPSEFAVLLQQIGR